MKLNRIFFFLILASSIVTFLPINAVPSISLTPNTGVIGSSSTIAGSGFHSNLINQTNNYQAVQQAGWNGNVNVEEFTALPPGNTINHFSLSPGNNGTGTFTQTNNFQTSHTAGFNGAVDVEKFTGLPAGYHISKFGLAIFTAAGNVRAKIYDDSNGGLAGNLLGESASIPVVSTPYQNFTVDAVIPADGTVWAGFETDSALLDLDWAPAGGTRYFVTHTYGPGPDPYGAGTSNNNPPWEQITYVVPHTGVRVKIYKDDGAAGAPSTLLAESGSFSITRTGVVDFPITATIPASGNVWAGFETNNTLLQLASTNAMPGVRKFVAHTYGNGPNPFGAVSASTVPNWERISYGNYTLSFKWDGSPLSTVPSTPSADNTGAFGGVTFNVPVSLFGGHVVNATDTGGSSATATFTIPYATSTFTLTGYVLGNAGFFPYPTLKVVSSSDVNMTQLQLYNQTNLLSTKNFSPPIHIFANTTMSIPWNMTDTNGRTGTQTYTEQATLKQGTYTQIISSNAVLLNYGSITIGKLGFNYTNPTQVPIWFHRQDIANNTRLDVIFPNSANLTCNLAYQVAQTNKDYFNIPKVTYDANQKNSSFLFVNMTNDFVIVNCKDLNNVANTGQFMLGNQPTNFPFVQQIKNFRSGMYGTTGQFGMLDIITLTVVIFSMIGFNRINEAVGAFFSLAIIGATAYFGILTFPGIVLGAVAVVTVLGVVSVRKIGGF